MNGTVGEKGDKGDKGSKGMKGNEGDKGPEGIKGDIGQSIILWNNLLYLHNYLLHVVLVGYVVIFRGVYT